MIKSVKGFNDILPYEIERWKKVESEARCVLEAFGFSEIKIPIVEKTALFQRGIGATTDIVEKEMYTFYDRKGESLTLRPEGTASIVRAYIEHTLFHKDPVAKLYYMGPMFRYERPQKGRLRQFYQIGVEVLGVDDPKLDAELLDMLIFLFDRLGIEDAELDINSLGCEGCRPPYRDKLLTFLKGKVDLLCKDCQRRLELNPLRVLDCKNPDCNDAVITAPFIKDNLCGNCEGHFGAVTEYLNVMGVPYRINPRVVRGLDYYTKTAFEIVSKRLGSQNAVAAGGRYDRLVREFGGPDTPCFGFAIGVERVVLLMRGKDSGKPYPLVYLVPVGGAASRESIRLLKELRRGGIGVELSYGEKSLKSHMRRANKLQVRYVVIIGDEELKKGVIAVKDMKEGIQCEVNMVEIVSFFRERLCGTQQVAKEGVI